MKGLADMMGREFDLPGAGTPAFESFLASRPPLNVSRLSHRCTVFRGTNFGTYVELCVVCGSERNAA